MVGATLQFPKRLTFAPTGRLACRAGRRHRMGPIAWRPGDFRLLVPVTLGAVVVLGFPAVTVTGPVPSRLRNAAGGSRAHHGRQVARAHERALRAAMLAERSALAHARLSEGGRMSEWAGALDVAPLWHVFESPGAPNYSSLPVQRDYTFWSSPPVVSPTAGVSPSGRTWLRRMNRWTVCTASTSPDPSCRPSA